jgi:hypothetical protein
MDMAIFRQRIPGNSFRRDTYEKTQDIRKDGSYEISHYQDPGGGNRSRCTGPAWRTRIEGSKGIAERERLGPVAGLQERYTEGLAALGADFPDVSAQEQDHRLRSAGSFVDLLYEHVCEGLYAAPEYGGNRDLAGWRSIGYPGDVQPRGYSDEEVSSA